MTQRGPVLLTLALSATGALACAHDIKNIYPEEQSRLDDNLVRFNWEDADDFIPWHEYIVQLGLDPEFAGAQALFRATKPSLVIDLTETFGPAKSVLFYWRVKARSNGVVWSGWSDTHSFLYDGKAQELKRLVALPPAPAQSPAPGIEVPTLLVFGAAESVAKEKTYSLTSSAEYEIAVRYFAVRLWEMAHFRQVERESLVELERRDDTVPPPRENYLFAGDKLNEVTSLQEVITWKLPDDYLVIDYHKLVNKNFLLFARLVDVRTGVVRWHHLEYVVQDQVSPGTFAALMAPTGEALAAAVGSGRSIVLAEVTENGQASEALKQAALPYLVKHTNFTLLLRNPPIARPVMLRRELPGGEIEMLEKTYYKLYDKQLSIVSRSAQQLWLEADENIVIDFMEATRPIHRSLLSQGQYSAEQLDLFWQQPRKSISATFVETRTGRIRSIVTVVARDDVSWSVLSLKLAEVLAR